MSHDEERGRASPTAEGGAPAPFRSEFGLPAPAVPPALAASVREAVKKTPSSRVPLARRLLFGALSLPLLLSVAPLVRWAFWGRLPIRPDLEGLSASEFGVRLLGAVAVALGASYGALGAGRRGLGLSVGGLKGLLMLSGPLYVVATILAPPDIVRPECVTTHLSLHAWGRPCALMALGTGSLTLATFTVALHRSVPVAPVLRGAALGAAAGLWAGVMLFVHCPARDMEHLLVGHGVPVLGFGFLGALLCPRFLKC